MKTTAIIFIASLFGVSLYAQQQQPQTQQPAVGNSKVNTDFSKYKTFTWAQPAATEAGPEGYDIYYYEFEDPDNEPNTKTKTATDGNVSLKQPPTAVYSYGLIIPAQDVTANNVIQDAISNELEGRGYRESPDGGDLIISYQVLDKKASLHGYTNDDPAIAQGEQVRQPSDTATFTLEPGALIVNLIDAGSSEVVWTGFSTNMMDNNAFITDEGELKEAVHTIFDQFKYTADKARKD